MADIDILKWVASGSGVVAALLIALNAGARVTGFGFLIFIGSSICWITSSLMQDEYPLLWQNVILLMINVVGAWRYLVVKAK